MTSPRWSTPSSPRSTAPDDPAPHALEAGWDVLVRRRRGQLAGRGRPSRPRCSPTTTWSTRPPTGSRPLTRPVIVAGGGALGRRPGAGGAGRAARRSGGDDHRGQGRRARRATRSPCRCVAAPGRPRRSRRPARASARALTSSRGPLPVPAGTAVIRVDVDPTELDQSVTAGHRHRRRRRRRGRRAGRPRSARAAILPTDAARHRRRVARARPAASGRHGASASPTWHGCCEQLRAAHPARRRARRRDDPGGLLRPQRLSCRRTPGSYLGSGYQGTLGFGYPTALGAKVGVGDRVVVSVNGDGGFLYNVAELSTAAQHGIGVIAVVFRDDAFGNVLRISRRSSAGDRQPPLQPRPRRAGRELRVAGHRVTEPRGLSRPRTAIADGGPAVIDVPSVRSPTCGAADPPREAG